MPHDTSGPEAPMEPVYVIGVGTTRFGRRADDSLRALADEAARSALADAGVDAGQVGAVVFGSCTSGEWGQPSVRGEMVLADGVVPVHTPIVNVEAGCATGAVAFRAACLEVAAGAGFALALGVDKTFLADPARLVPMFEGATDRLRPDDAAAFYAAEAAAAGDTFAPDPRRSVLLDVAALVARQVLRRGATPRTLAAVAAKNRRHGAGNPHATLREVVTADQVLADRVVIEPLTRSMCAPLADGAAAVLVASESALTPALRARAVRVLGFGAASGARRPLGSASVASVAADRAFAAAGLPRSAVTVAEVHDANAAAELVALEALGLFADAAGATEAGATTHGGDVVVNPSGGLIARGHPLAASGLAMVDAITRQIRGGAHRVGLVHNAGGQVGFDEASCAVILLGA